MGIKRLEFRQILFFSLGCLLLFAPLTEARRIHSPETSAFSLNGPIIGPDGHVSIDGVSLKFSPLFKDYRLIEVDEKRYALISPDEVMEFMVDLRFSNPEDGLATYIDYLQPLPSGTDRLKNATIFLEENSIVDLKKEFSESKHDTVFAKVSESDWERLRNIANKFGLGRLIEYFNRANGIISIEDALYYLLEFVPNPRDALETMEDITMSLAATDPRYRNLSRYGEDLTEAICSMRDRIPQFSRTFIQETRGKLVEGMDNSMVEVFLSKLALDVNEGLTSLFQKMVVFLRGGIGLNPSGPDVWLIAEDINFIITILEDFAKGKLSPNYKNLTAGVTPEENGEICIKDGQLGIWSRNRKNNQETFTPLVDFIDTNSLPSVRVCYVYCGDQDQSLRIGSRFNWRDLYMESNFDIRFLIAGVNYQLRFDKEMGKILTLDLGGPNISGFLKIWDSIAGESSGFWSTHHCPLLNLAEFINSIPERSIKMQVENVLRLIFPLSDSRYSSVMVITELLEAFC